MTLDLVSLAPSRILAVTRAAFDTPGTDILCFGESDQSAPAAAALAARAAPWPTT
jgi:hypothetical protein